MIDRRTEGPLFSPKLRHDAPATSRAAAERVLPKVGTQRRKVYECVHQSCGAGCGPHGLTDEQIGERLAMAMGLNSVRPRRKELQEAGLIEQRGTRKTASGCEAAVWVVTG